MKRALKSRRIASQVPQTLVVTIDTLAKLNVLKYNNKRLILWILSKDAPITAKFAPKFDELSVLFKHVTFASVNVDLLPDVTLKLDIDTIPSLCVFEKGCLESKRSYVSSEEMVKDIQDFCANNVLFH